MTEVSVAPLGDDKKLVLHRMFLNIWNGGMVVPLGILCYTFEISILSSRRRITINCYVTGTAVWWCPVLTEVSVAPSGADKKSVLHRIFLKLSGCWHLAQTCILYEWAYVRRFL